MVPREEEGLSHARESSASLVRTEDAEGGTGIFLPPVRHSASPPRTAAADPLPFESAVVFASRQILMGSERTGQRDERTVQVKRLSISQ